MFLLNLINHVLRQNPLVLQELSGYNGMVVAMESGTWRVVGQIGDDGSLLPTTRRADTQLQIHPQSLPKLFRGELPNLNDLAVQGDIQLGMNLLFCLQNIQYSPQYDLRQVLGDETTDQLTQKAHKIGKTLQIVGQTLLFQAASLQQNAPETHSQNQQLTQTLNECVNELDELRHEIRIINKRLEQLESCLQIHE